eukprot:gene37345-59350_t
MLTGKGDGSAPYDPFSFVFKLKEGQALDLLQLPPDDNPGQ